jgi:aminopeptidase N
MQACAQRLNASATRPLANTARATATARATHAAPVRASASRSVPSRSAKSSRNNRNALNSASNDKLNAGMTTSTGSPVASKTSADAEDSVLCRSVEEKRTPLINLEGGRQISYVRCSCSKCQGLVMCGDKQLLPTAVTPSHYDLHLTPNLVTFAYDGLMTVKLTVHEPTDAITFHARDLNIASGVVTDADGVERTNPGGPDVLYGDEGQETATVALAVPFTEKDVGSTVTLTVKFTGELNDKLAGFYRSAYPAPENPEETRYLAVTQFEPTDARRCFPCWDEPSLKATFQMTLTVPENRVALSNMPEATVVKDAAAKTKTVTFETTPVMSTYLLAFCVGEFDVIEDTTKEGVTVRCWTPVGKKEQGKFALDTAVGSLSFFGEYFDSAYPLPKMDMVAVPDFSAGAMENWGLVVYRASLMLYEEGKTPVNAKQRIGYVVGHELAHQWFGNLVTMEWWSQLWLNEGFATWVGWRAMDHLYPEWRVWSQFLVNEQSMGLGLDSLRSSHPVEVPIAAASQVTEIFDAISYSKGSCVIRMLEAHLGEATFREGMRLYVRRHQYANAGTTDLWQALSEASGEDVAGLMSCWTAQTGYPILNVSSSTGEDGESVVTVAQRRYLASGPDSLTDEENAVVWKVPLRAGEAFADVPGLLEDDAAVFAVSQAQRDQSRSGALKLNLGQSGFYRVAYDESERVKLISAIPKMDEVDRVGIVSDAFACGASGYATSTDALELLDAYRGDASYVVWSEIASGVGGVVSAFFEQPENVSVALSSFGADLFAPLVDKLGWEADSSKESGADASAYQTQLLRQLAVSRALAFEDPRAVAEARKRFDKYVAGDVKAVPADLKGAVFASALRQGGMPEFELLKKLYKDADSSLEESLVLGAMGASKDPAVIKSALDFNMTDAVRKQDGAAIVGSAAGSRAGKRVVWDWVRENWDAVEGKFGGGGVSSGLTRIIGASCSGLASEADAADIEAFYLPKKIEGAERTVSQAAEAVRARAARVDRDAEKVGKWLLAR